MKHLLILFTILTLISCRQGSRQKQQADTPPVITVTIEPLRNWTEAIAGNRFQVVSMVPKGSSPETYDPTPRQLADLTHSCAYLSTGYLGFEQTWHERLKQNAPHLTFFELSQGIDLIYSHSHTPHTQHPGNYEEEESHTPGVEPHLWMSVANARIIVRNICTSLCSLAPSHQAEFRHRTDSLCRQLDKLDSYLRSFLSASDADSTFLIYHPALSYFARDYGLRQISIEADGKEPSAAQLKSVIDQCKREMVSVIFVQPEFDQRNAKLIAKEIAAIIVSINPLDYHWEQEMRNIAEHLNISRLTDIHLLEETGRPTAR